MSRFAIPRPAAWGVRLRSAVASAAVVGVVLLLAAAAMLWLLNRSLVAAVDDAAAARAADVADELRHTTPVGLDASAFGTDSRISVVQVVDAAGRVLRASSPAFPTPVRTVPPHSAVTGLRAQPPYDPDLRVAARPAGALTVLTASSRESTEHTLAVVAVLLALLGPLVVAAAALATYQLVGRSLRSVEAIRARVAELGAADLADRVPVPLARDEVARLAETMNDMLARVQAGHTARQRFVADASHELRSPLATLTAALELARDRPEVLDRELLTHTLLPEAERMRQLIADLLTLAAADESGLELRTGDVDLDDVADTEARALRLRRDIAVVAAIAPARVRGDRAKLARVVRNLLDNAATHAASTVWVWVEQDAERARLTVDDDGPGIPAAARERVFERFVRLAADRARASGGSGLGLAIVAEIVAAHHGVVTIADSPAGGARVVVELPAG